MQRYTLPNRTTGRHYERFGQSAKYTETRAPQAAGKIHSDFEKGFIRAEIVTYDDLVTCGGFTQAKEKGKVRSEGKEYVFRDGDVALFRFNV